MGFEVIDGLDLFNDIPGWRLHLAHLALEPGCHEQVLEVITRGTMARVHKRFPDGSMAGDGNVEAVREALGGREGLATSERLAREILDGRSLPQGHPGQVLCDVLALRTLLPWSVMDAEKVLLPLKFRAGQGAESGRYGDEVVDLVDRPLLTDGEGIVASPCASGAGSGMSPETTQVIVVCYTPLAVAKKFEARTELARVIWTTWAFRFVTEKAFKPKG